MGPLSSGFKRLRIFAESQPTMALTILRSSVILEEVGIVNPDYNRKKHGGLYASMSIMAVSLFALSFSVLGESTLFHTTIVTDVYAQPYVETVKHRGLTIDLGDGVKTNAQ